MTTETLEPLLHHKQSEVESWRLHILLKAGYPLLHASQLAMSNCDLHLACAMLHRGCQPDTAAQILP